MTETRTRESSHQRAERITRQRFARRQWARRWMRWKFAVAVVSLVALVGAAVWLVFYSTTLSVTRVDVVGNKLLSDDRVTRVAAVPAGEQLALVDLEEATRRVETLSEVVDADVTRAWPDTVLITLTERVAVAVVELGGRIRGLDADGVLFREYTSVPPGLPRVQPQTSTGTDALKEAAGVVSTLPRDLAARVDHVEVQTIDQITLVLRDGREVRWGSAEESELKATVLVRLLEAQQAPVYDVSVPASPTYSSR
ncbi:MAG: Cell division protein FtsQ [Nocardioides sp.]|jgi:cell division protein FtsQ|uniref:cell division protein FtsQ/DivIB n=1 Tax=Nocardioides sp. TaxID=35761 RepID=UPI00262269C4|nr:FtsQ-type POTRA domain-containing protein [Nocardioides sp.]MCW2832396.1 Cell division protein FtsQ [Nocardioides sp.]